MRRLPLLTAGLALCVWVAPSHAQTLDSLQRERASRFILDLQEAVRYSNKPAIAQMIRFPLRVTRLGAAAQTVRDSAEFVHAFDRLFGYDVRAAVLAQRTDSLGGTWGDIRLGSGYVWLDAGCEDQQPIDGCMKVWAITFTEGPRAATRGGLRDRIWMRGGLGYGTLAASCTGCASRSNRGAPGFSVDFGAVITPHFRLGLEGACWGHNLAHDSVEVVCNTGLLLWAYPRAKGGAYLIVGAVLSQYGTYQETSFWSLHADGVYLSGSGSGYALGAGWEVAGPLALRALYEHGNVGTLQTTSGATSAAGWRDDLILFEASITMDSRFIK